MAGTIAPIIKHQYCDANGAPYAGAKLFTYAAGTSTKQSTYTDAALSAANTNPIVLDSAGRCTMFLSPTNYKFVLAPSTDTDPPAAPIWTVDNVSATPPANIDVDVSGTCGDTFTAGHLAYLSAGDGGLTAGRWYKADADNAYSSTATSALGFVVADAAAGAAGSFRTSGRVTGLSGLSAGSIYYASATAGEITTSAPANARAVGIADSATSLIVSGWLAGPAATATITGTVSTSAQTMAGLKTFSGGVQSGIPVTFNPAGWTNYGATCPGHLTSVYVSVGNVGGGEDDLMTYSLPAGTLGADGRSIIVVAWGTTANNANAKTLKGYFGATQVLGGSGASLTASEAGNWIAGFKVMRTGATAQRAMGQFMSGPSGGVATTAGTAVTTPAETLANAITIKFTGQATTDNDIIQTGMSVTLL